MNIITQLVDALSVCKSHPFSLFALPLIWISILDTVPSADHESITYHPLNNRDIMERSRVIYINEIFKYVKWAREGERIQLRHSFETLIAPAD